MLSSSDEEAAAEVIRHNKVDSKGVTLGGVVAAVVRTRTRGRLVAGIIADHRAWCRSGVKEAAIVVSRTLGTRRIVVANVLILNKRVSLLTIAAAKRAARSIINRVLYLHTVNTVKSCT